MRSTLERPCGPCYFKHPRHARVAQWIERSPPERKAAGSTPAAGISKTEVRGTLSGVLFLFRRQAKLIPARSYPARVCAGGESVSAGGEESGDEEEERGDETGAGDREYPGPDDAARHAPLDGGEAARRADADDGARDGVRGRDGDAGQGHVGERQGRARLGAEAADRLELRDARAHRAHDAPAARKRAESEGRVGAEDDPQRYRRQRSVRAVLQEAARRQNRRDDAHRLLRVVAAVAEREGRRREELALSEEAVNAVRRPAAENPVDGDPSAAGWRTSSRSGRAGPNFTRRGSS